jgi:ribosomal protein S18 acetylase RimI-like enzyme
MKIRHAEPTDYGRVIGVLDVWWGGRRMSPMLPKLFFVHFESTSFIAEDGDRLAGFICGFLSQTHEDEAYVHFVGVDPEYRGQGLGRTLYERFFESAQAAGRTVVHAVTSPVNTPSVAFHESIGFEVARVDENYDGSGESRLLLVKRL